MFGKNQDEAVSVNGKSVQGQIRTLISEGCKFEGNLFSPSYTRIDGIVIGNVTGESGIVVGEKGNISGDIKAVEVIVCGRVNGNIKSQDLYIKSTGNVNGNVSIDSIIMEKGSAFDGNCTMKKADVLRED